MGALAQGQKSDCANPVLDIFTQVNGVLTDVFLLEFQIFDVTGGEPGVQTFPVAGRETVDVGTICPAAGAGKISTGRFVAEWDVPLVQPVGTHRIKWFFKLTASSNEQTFAEDFEVLPEATATGSVGYTTVAAMRAEGVPSTGTGGKTDAELLKLITLASRYIDKLTRRFFEPRVLTFNFDGAGGSQLLLGDPIIGITSLKVGFAGDLSTVTEVDLENVKIYNRHLSQNLLNPDDRDNPRIALIAGQLDRPRLIGGFRTFPDAFQNIELTGTFGYTDFNGAGSSSGKTPELIEYITKKIVVRYLPKLTDDDAVDSALGAGRIKKLRTRDQEIQYFSASEGGPPPGLWTGDPEIDHIIAGYMRPPDIEATQLTVRGSRTMI